MSRRDAIEGRTQDGWDPTEISSGGQQELARWRRKATRTEGATSLECLEKREKREKTTHTHRNHVESTTADANTDKEHKKLER